MWRVSWHMRLLLSMPANRTKASAGPGQPTQWTREGFQELTLPSGHYTSAVQSETNLQGVFRAAWAWILHDGRTGTSGKRTPTFQGVALQQNSGRKAELYGTCWKFNSCDFERVTGMRQCHFRHSCEKQAGGTPSQPIP